jgi:hypothetical protein
MRQPVHLITPDGKSTDLLSVIYRQLIRLLETRLHVIRSVLAPGQMTPYGPDMGCCAALNRSPRRCSASAPPKKPVRK